MKTESGALGAVVAQVGEPLAEGSATTPPAYAALIRAYRASSTLEALIRALQSQSHPPSRIIVVDSSQDEQTSSIFSGLGATVVPYGPEPFNFSTAINLGVEANPFPFTLIVSSHVEIGVPEMVQAGFQRARQLGVEVFYWLPTWAEQPDDGETLICRSTFDGRNGLSNSMAMIPTALIAERPFRPEVFSAEDQEWALYYFTRFARPILQIRSTAMGYINPNHRAGAWNERKLLNEQLALGLFVDRRFIGADKVAARVLRSVLAIIRLRPARARLHAFAAWSMLQARFQPPQVKSRYF